MTNSPQTYTGTGLAATVSISTSSVPGTVANILTGGAATQTTAGTYAVTASFVPTDTTDLQHPHRALGRQLRDRQGDADGAPWPVTNSPQTYTGSGLAATVSISTSSVPGTVPPSSPAGRHPDDARAPTP